MTGQGLIDAVISFYDNTLSTDADNTTRRTRVLHNAQMVLEEVWNHRAWPFKTKISSLSFTSGVASLPTDFSRMGPDGLVWDPSTLRVWVETYPQELLDKVVKSDAQRQLYAIMAQDGTTRKIYIPDTSAPRTLSIFYEVAPPTLADSSAEISAIPPSYHRTVLLAGTISRTQIDKNDVRMYYEKQYLLGLGRMVVNELPLQGRVKQLPLSVGKMSW